MEQLVPPHFIFFYSASTKDPMKTSAKLKLFLSQNLLPFIDCDDSGATFIEAQLDGNMTEMFKEPQMDLLEQRLPFSLNEKFNYFCCCSRGLL